MKRTHLLLVLLLSSLSSWAQSEEAAISLGEASVTGAKVVSKVDGLAVYPTEAQKQASTNGYSLLQKLSLPNLRVDLVQHTVTAADNRGGVVVKIRSKPSEIASPIANSVAILVSSPEQLTVST